MQKFVTTYQSLPPTGLVVYRQPQSLTLVGEPTEIISRSPRIQFFLFLFGVGGGLGVGRVPGLFVDFRVPTEGDEARI